jgi:hypothetical protein
MSNLLYNNVNNNHPLITNSQDYAIIKKYISIHSEDRDLFKFPTASEFEIMLPEDMNNVSYMKLADWSFPTSYSTYSLLAGNVTMTFKINKPINPATIIPPPADLALQILIYEALSSNIDNNYTITIEEGIYTGPQLAIELTNKFNVAVTIFIKSYFIEKGYTGFTSYTEFVIVYSLVTQILLFGNRSSSFILTNTTQFPFQYSPKQDCNNCKSSSISTVYSTLPYSSNPDNKNACFNAHTLPSSYDYGLPSYLGLLPCNTESTESLEDLYFYYTTPFIPWLTPSFAGTSVYYVTAPKKAQLNSQVYFYLDLAGYNCIDETSPFNISNFTLTTNTTNGIVNAAFAKINAVANLTGSYLDKSPAYKYFMPPAERIRKLKIKCRYHNNSLVEFNGLPYSLLFEFGLFVPQQIRSQHIYDPKYGK